MIACVATFDICYSETKSFIKFKKQYIKLHLTFLDLLY